MFEIESKNQDEITIITKTKRIRFDLAREEIDAELEVGKIVGPGSLRLGRQQFGDCSGREKDGI